MKTLRFNNSRQGFTLVELLVAMVMGLVVLGAVLNIFIHQNRTNAVQQEVAYAQQNVRGAVSIMAREIRAAGQDPQGGGFTPVATATGTSIRIRADYSDPNSDGKIEGDGDAADLGEDVTYAVNGSSQLTKDDANDAQPACAIVDFVNSLQFIYTFADGGTGVPDETDGDSTNDLADIRSVTVQLQVSTETPDPNTGQFRTRTLVNTVRIRNVGFQDLE